jgi:NOL1/NOP2/fmu family ribosome biogenesis protein
MEENIHNVHYFQEHFHLDSVPLDFDHHWGIQTIEKDASTGYQLYPHKLTGEGLFIALLKNNNESSTSYGKPKKPFQLFEPLPSWLKAHVASPESMVVNKKSLENEMISMEAMDKANALLMHVPKALAIVSAGEMKGRDFVPSHALATSGLASNQFGIIPADLSMALDFLERNASTLPSAEQKGWYLIQFMGTTLGWAKWTGQGWKNHFPMVWRLRDRGKK